MLSSKFSKFERNLTIGQSAAELWIIYRIFAVVT